MHDRPDSYRIGHVRHAAGVSALVFLATHTVCYNSNDPVPEM